MQLFCKFTNTAIFARSAFTFFTKALTNSTFVVSFDVRLKGSIGRAPQARGPEGCGDPVHRHWGVSDPHAHGMREWGARA